MADLVADALKSLRKITEKSPNDFRGKKITELEMGPKGWTVPPRLYYAVLLLLLSQHSYQIMPPMPPVPPVPPGATGTVPSSCERHQNQPGAWVCHWHYAASLGKHWGQEAVKKVPW